MPRCWNLGWVYDYKVNSDMNIRAILFLLILQVLSACSNDVPECFQDAGESVSYEVQTEAFESITIAEGIELIIEQGNERKIVVETGENLREHITVNVINGELIIHNNSGCNWVRQYNTTRVYVTTPHLKKVYSASQFAVLSQGVLSFSDLTLQSGMLGETASGTFELEVNSQNLTIEDNQSVYCNIFGAVENLRVNFYSGDARFDGANLIAQRVNIFHRSSNDIIVNPQQEVKGIVSSTGNLILKHLPPLVEIEQLYTGHVVYD